MSKSKIIALIGVISLAFAMTAIGNAVAGEKVGGRNVFYNVKWEQIEVGDEEGHVLGVFEHNGIQSRLDGKTFLIAAWGLMDMNVKTGAASGSGYGVTTDMDGDKMYWTWEGKAVKEGISRGTWTFTKGTGKYEGIKGKGTYTHYDVAPRQSYSDWEGEQELP